MDSELKNVRKFSKAEESITQPETKEEPDKFEIGDWIIDNIDNKNLTIKLCIIGKENNKYCFCGFSVRKSTIDKFYRKWTINDASDGDLLTIKTYKIFSGLLVEDEWIVKFNKIKDQSILVYLACEKNGASCIENMSFTYSSDKQVRPATQEEENIFGSKTRERYNTLIAETISNHLSEKPDIRFGQFIEEFLKSDASTNLNTEEPFSTYKNIKHFITKNKNKDS